MAAWLCSPGSRSAPGPQCLLTACAYSVCNPVLAQIATRFCKQIGFHGIADLDWRLDRRDGRYKLVDFNPRVGNQFRLFETDTGIDVVRALHLDLTGRSVPMGEQVYGADSSSSIPTRWPVWPTVAQPIQAPAPSAAGGDGTGLVRAR